MGNLASPVEIAAIAAAVAWPFVLGLAVVMWSKARAAERQRRLAALDGELKGMFRNVEGRPVPDRLTLVVEALEEAEALKPSPNPSKRPVPAA